MTYLVLPRRQARVELVVSGRAGRGRSDDPVVRQEIAKPLTAS